MRQEMSGGGNPWPRRFLRQQLKHGEARDIRAPARIPSECNPPEASSGGRSGSRTEIMTQRAP
jgi:hypothetical protein